MELSEQLFSQIVGQSRVSTANRSERRGSTRIPLTFRTTMVPIVGSALGIPVMVKVREFSRMGVSLLHSGAVRPGQPFLLRLIRRDDTPIWVSCRAVRWQPISSRLSLIGASFERVVNYRDPAPPAAIADKPFVLAAEQETDAAKALAPNQIADLADALTA